jgi:hypothetical protein
MGKTPPSSAAAVLQQIANIGTGNTRCGAMTATNSFTAGQKAPTLIVNPVDNLVIDFQNQMPAATPRVCTTMKPCGGMSIGNAVDSIG